MAETTLKFQRTETIVLELDVRDQNDVLVDPATSVKVTVTDLDGTAVVDAVDMVKDSTGKYHYDYTPIASAVLGWHRVHYVVVDAARTTILDDGFTLEA